MDFHFQAAGANGVVPWSEIVASEEHRRRRHNNPQGDGEQRQLVVPVIYNRRRKPIIPNPIATSNDLLPIKANPNPGNRVTSSRVSWNRSLSSRGRASISISACVNFQPQHLLTKPKRKPRPPGLPKVKSSKSLNFDKERAYFEEVDSFQLVEESPSPKNSATTWATGVSPDDIPIPALTSRLQKWLTSKQISSSCGPSCSLSNIFVSPAIPEESSCQCDGSRRMKTPEKAPHKFHDLDNPSFIMSKYFLERKWNACPEKSTEESISLGHDSYEEVEAAIKKLSFASQYESSNSGHNEPFLSLLQICGQTAPLTLSDVLSKYCAPESIEKLGEGTYGEAFKVGDTVCKIVPVDGDLRVNGEIQKRSEELLGEVKLSHTLNRLRGNEDQIQNACLSFINTVDLSVCRGSYDASLIKAWEHWDEDHGSENDHPKEFPDNQCYVVFVLEHGGQDLESFVLLDFNEAKSLLLQVIAGLGVAENAYEFEHRDLHWGNILLSRKGSERLQFILGGKHLYVNTFGLSVSIIDFSLSRINTGEEIHFMDLSLDPELFEGQKGDKQAETYRKMKEVTDHCWEGSFPKTNVLWLQYLVDILLSKKSFKRTKNDERDLRSLKKRLNGYGSAKEVISDPLFLDLFIDHAL